MRPFLRSALAAGAVLAGTASLSPQATAHPHVFLTQTVAVVFEKGAIVALEHVWTFDEFFTAMAVADLDTNKDGQFSREELAPLAKTNIDALKDFNYYTHAKLAGTALKFNAPTSYWGSVKDGALSLHFRLPLAQPVLAEAKGFEFSVYDPSFFIAFEYTQTGGITLAGSPPQGCAATTAEPEKTAADVARLGESFFEQLGGGPLGNMSIAKTVRITCPAK
jgi:ABC-type uncharacterized transport system substrate-binding protein